MKTILRPYPEYLDCCLPWLGRIPAHWSVKKLRHCGKIVGGSTPSMSRSEFWNGPIPWVSPKDMKTTVIRGSIDRLTELALQETSIRAIDPPAILLVVRGMILARRIPIAVTQVRTTINQDMKALLPFYDIDAKFLLYALEASKDNFSELIDEAGHGTKRLPTERWRELGICYPPPVEQAAIVRFLDHADQKIRHILQAKRRLIGLLSEQKQGIISQAVVCGLQSLTAKRPSSHSERPRRNQQGIPWLSEIPDHWDILPSKRLFSVRKELVHPGDVQLSATQAFGVIPQAEFEEKVGRKVVRISLHLEKRRHVEKNDFVISMRSFQGGLERAWAAGCIRSSYVVLKPDPSINVNFFAYLFKSYEYISALRATANFIRDGQDLNFSNFCLVDLPVIPLDEQRAIADHLDRSTKTINTTIDRAREEVRLLQEYRTRLVADVTAGKLDVREAAEKLPFSMAEEAPDDDPFDLSSLDPDEEDGKEVTSDLLTATADED